jgi:sugar phosphate isomerase/epimerase
MTAEHYQEIFAELMGGIIRSASPGGARQRIPGPRSHHGLLADELEGFTRSFIMAGPWLARRTDPVIEYRGEQYDIAAFYRRGILHGTDPNHTEYWGDINDYAQHLVEMASLAWSLYLSRAHIWDRFSAAEQQQVADYLFQCTRVEYHQNNWLLFNVVTNAVLKKLGMPYSQEQINRNIEACDHMYIGDGWYRDGKVNRIDYYNAWAFHYYYLIWVYLEGDEHPELAELHKERIRTFAHSLRYFISGDGSPPCFGRSMIYRFGYLAPLALGYTLGALDIPVGELRTMFNATLKFFFEREILTDLGHLSMGFLRPAEGILEHYNCGGSPYWAVKALNILLLPRDDPFWTSPEEPLPIHRGSYSVPLKSAGLLLLGGGRKGHVQLVNHKSYHDKDEYNAKYTNFAYSSVFTYDSRSVYGSFHSDASLQWSADGINFHQRWQMENLYCEQDFAASTYPLHKTDPEGSGTTWTIVKDDLLVHIHRLVTTKRGIIFREGSYALGFDEGLPQIESVQGAEIAWTDGRCAMLANVYGYERTIPFTPFHEQIHGVNSRYWKSAAAKLEREMPAAGEALLISAVLGRIGSDAADTLLSLLPQAAVNGRLVTLSFSDGELVLLNTRPEEGDINVELGGWHITGRPVLVRLREGQEPVRVEARSGQIRAGGRTFIAGLVSVTFRSLPPAEVIRLARDAGLELIEWGGDVHVPPGDLKRAREVATLCREAGIGITAYGSYYRLGSSSGREESGDEYDTPAGFEQILETAVELGAPRIRIWAGEKGSAETNCEERDRIAAEARNLAEQAAEYGITLCFEYHEESLTDTCESTQSLLYAADHPGVRTYWQPLVGSRVEENTATLNRLADKLEVIHVSQRDAEGRRLPFAEGLREWRQYLEAAAEKPGAAPVPLMLEFLSEENAEQLREDAGRLQQLVRESVH